ncbi:MATE family efflux transporter [Mesosutterella sp. AGMB02718]|uniref:MATE family efflux transporter n=1 Tax=Mesosutterella faecium TaxID=2925194 RepID=A0ABT7INC7_9BURK|nr:MATE family efflux transporter [Mesosutterella sp. AGMB02718]MDL2059888.1 MATE family efflux transporter [Mesosutterella sp. AGMB02718]
MQARSRPDPATEALFRSAPAGRAILELALPTIAAQLITVIYAVVDIFYVGQLGDPAQVAAVRIAFPPFLFLTALANLFGIGASSAIGRALGAGNTEKARRCAAFAFWCGIAVAVLYAALIWEERGRLLPLLGAAGPTWEPTVAYLSWMIGLGALPLVASNVLAHLVRAEGHARVAGRGIALGGFLNILIAPFFIFTLGLEVRGAAIAGFISNVVSALYIGRFVLMRQGRGTVVSLSPRLAREGSAWAFEIFSVGFASFVMTGLASFSNAVLNFLASGYGPAAVAGLGIAKQVDQMIFSCSIGLAQGTLPLIAYNFSSGDHGRLRRVMKTALLGGVSCSAAATLLLVAFSEPLTRAFIAEPVTAAHASKCVRIIAIACPLSIIGHLMVSGFQACGARWRPLFLAFIRKGSIDAPLMWLFSSLFGFYGIAAAVPVSELISCSIGLALFLPFIARLDGRPVSVTNATAAKEK